MTALSPSVPPPGCPQLGVNFLFVLLLLGWTVGISVRCPQLWAPEKPGAWRAAQHKAQDVEDAVLDTGGPERAPRSTAPHPCATPRLDAGHAHPRAVNALHRKGSICLASPPSSPPGSCESGVRFLPALRAHPASKGDTEPPTPHSAQKGGWRGSISKGRKTRNSWLPPKNKHWLTADRDLGKSSG